MVTVTSVSEARVAVARGAASLSVQGPNAGGHRGTWDLEAPPDKTPLLDLVSAVLAVVDVPVVAGGGVHDAAGLQSLRDAGAAAAQVGTAYLLAEEAGTNPTHRAALEDPAFPETAVTRAYTGRWARGLANRFIAAHADAPAGYPHVHHLTSPLRRAAAAAGDTDVAHMWAGTGHVHTRACTRCGDHPLARSLGIPAASGAARALGCRTSWRAGRMSQAHSASRRAQHLLRQARHGSTTRQ